MHCINLYSLLYAWNILCKLRMPPNLKITTPQFFFKRWGGQHCQMQPRGQVGNWTVSFGFQGGTEQFHWNDGGEEGAQEWRVRKRQWAQLIFPGGEGGWVRKRTFRECSVLSAFGCPLQRASRKATDPLLFPPPISPLRKSILLLIAQGQDTAWVFVF